MMTARILPPAEWPRLAGTLLEDAWPHFDRDRTQVMVIEQADQILACAALFPAWHLEGAWIAPAYRRRLGLGRRFLRFVRATAERIGVREVAMMATTAAGRRLCEGVGSAHQILTGDHFMVRL